MWIKPHPRRGAAAGWNPAALFSGGQDGYWYDFQRIGTLWQDAGQVTPVASDGDPIGFALDLSGNGNHATASGAARPVWKTSGGLSWVEFDGSTQHLDSGVAPFDQSGLLASARFTGSSSSFYVWWGARTDNTTNTLATFENNRIGAAYDSDFNRGGTADMTGTDAVWYINYGPNGNAYYAGSRTEGTTDFTKGPPFIPATWTRTGSTTLIGRHNDNGTPANGAPMRLYEIIYRDQVLDGSPGSDQALAMPYLRARIGL